MPSPFSASTPERPARPGPAGQTAPRPAKPGQIKPNKIAWFCLGLFVRIGTFQWVIGNPNKNFFLDPILAAAAERTEARSGEWETYTTGFRFSQEIESHFREHGIKALPVLCSNRRDPRARRAHAHSGL